MKLLVFDTETTGLPEGRKPKISESDKWPHILQFSYILYDTDTNRVLQEANDIIKLPEDVVISPKSIQIHGITRNTSEKHGISIKHAINKFKQALMRADILIAHNLEFDKRLYMAECYRNKMRHDMYDSKIYHCTMKANINRCKISVTNSKGETYFKYPSLLELHKELFNTEPINLHNAFCDILICLRCYYQIKYAQDIGYKNRRIGTLLSQYCKL